MMNPLEPKPPDPSHLSTLPFRSFCCSALRSQLPLEYTDSYFQKLNRGNLLEINQCFGCNFIFVMLVNKAQQCKLNPRMIGDALPGSGGAHPRFVHPNSNSAIPGNIYLFSLCIDINRQLTILSLLLTTSLNPSNVGFSILYESAMNIYFTIALFKFCSCVLMTESALNTMYCTLLCFPDCHSDVIHLFRISHGLDIFAVKHDSGFIIKVWRLRIFIYMDQSWWPFLHSGGGILGCVELCHSSYTYSHFSAIPLSFKKRGLLFLFCTIIFFLVRIWSMNLIIDFFRIPYISFKWKTTFEGIIMNIKDYSIFSTCGQIVGAALVNLSGLILIEYQSVLDHPCVWYGNFISRPFMVSEMEIIIFVSKSTVLIKSHEFWMFSIKDGPVATAWLVLMVNLSPEGSDIHLEFLSNFGGILSVSSCCNSPYLHFFKSSDNFGDNLFILALSFCAMAREEQVQECRAITLGTLLSLYSSDQNLLQKNFTYSLSLLKSSSPLDIMKVHNYELLLNTVDMLYCTESALVREIQNESNLNCISKACIQNAFGPSQTYLSLLCCYDNCLMHYIRITFLALLHLALYLRQSDSSFLPFKCKKIIEGSLHSHWPSIHYCVWYGKINSFPYLVREMEIHTVISKTTLQNYPFRVWTSIFDAKFVVSIKLVKLSMGRSLSCITIIEYFLTFIDYLRLSLHFRQSDKEANISDSVCNAYRQCWQDDLVSIYVDLCLVFHIHICMFYSIVLFFLFSSWFWGKVEIPYRIFP